MRIKCSHVFADLKFSYFSELVFIVKIFQTKIQIKCGNNILCYLMLVFLMILFCVSCYYIQNIKTNPQSNVVLPMLAPCSWELCCMRPCILCNNFFCRTFYTKCTYVLMFPWTLLTDFMVIVFSQKRQKWFLTSLVWYVHRHFSTIYPCSCSLTLVKKYFW